MSALSKRMSSFLKRTPTDLATSLEKKENPETRAPRLVKEFCNASSENSSAADEVIYLPYIREAVEANPAAAKGALKAINKYIANSISAQPGALYNAVMLIRILADSPGPAFTQHFDDRFVGTVRSMLKNCNKQEPQLILQQTLEYFQREKSSDPNLTGIIAMWEKQKSDWANAAAQRRGWAGSGFAARQSQPNARLPNKLPAPQELAERIAEADTSVQLLTQFLQTTPQEELPGNELVQEFTNRCKAARDSMQAYIDCTNPSPDPDTMMTLVQTQQRISAVLNRRNVAISQARAAVAGSGASSPAPGINGTTNPTSPLASPTGRTATNVTSNPASPAPQLPPVDVAADPAARLDNPFDDSNQIALNGNGAGARAGGGGGGALGGAAERQRPALSLSTSSFTRRTGSNNGNGNGSGAAGEAKPENTQPSRFRIV